MVKMKTNGAEGIFSGIYGKSSFSLGGTVFQTDGFRENNDQKDKIVNVFFQQQISHKTSVQAEYRYRDNERGDVSAQGLRGGLFDGPSR